MKHYGTHYTPRGCRWTRGDARGTDWGHAVQQSQAKDFADQVKILTWDTAIGRQRMPRNQRENVEEVISSTPSSSSRTQSTNRGHFRKKLKSIRQWRGRVRGACRGRKDCGGGRVKGVCGGILRLHGGGSGQTPCVFLLHNKHHTPSPPRQTVCTVLVPLQRPCTLPLPLQTQTQCIFLVPLQTPHKFPPL